jgi:hypothetical protein
MIYIESSLLSGCVARGERTPPVRYNASFKQSKTRVILYFVTNYVTLIKNNEWAGHVARMEEKRGVYRDWVGKTGGQETTWKSQTQM